MKNNGPILVISAPSGAGKSTIIQQIMKQRNDLGFSISTTTRNIRAGESEGINYYFIVKDEFEKKIEEDCFVEWALVHNNYYGTSKKEIDRIIADKKIPVLDIDVQGAKILQKTLKNAVYVFIIPPSLNVLKKRLVGRNTESEDQIAVRMQNAVTELKEYGYYDYLIINDNLEESVAQLSNILDAQLHKTEFMKKYIENILED